MRRTLDSPSEPPDGDLVCRRCDSVMEYNPLIRDWECVHDHDALELETEDDIPA